MAPPRRVGGMACGQSHVGQDLARRISIGMSRVNTRELTANEVHGTDGLSMLIVPLPSVKPRLYPGGPSVTVCDQLHSCHTD